MSNKDKIGHWNDAIEEAARIMDRWYNEAKLSKHPSGIIQTTLCQNAANAIRRLKK